MRRLAQYLLPLAFLAGGFPSMVTRAGAVDEGGPLNTLHDLFAQIGKCWRSPRLPDGDLGMQITVLVSFNRSGAVLGPPRITYETEGASDDDRLAYRAAVATALQRCTPLRFTDGLAGAIAGRPIAFRFDDRRKPPKSKERDAWLTTKTL